MSKTIALVSELAIQLAQILTASTICLQAQPRSSRDEDKDAESILLMMVGEGNREVSILFSQMTVACSILKKNYLSGKKARAGFMKHQHRTLKSGQRSFEPGGSAVNGFSVLFSRTYVAKASIYKEH